MTKTLHPANAALKIARLEREMLDTAMAGPGNIHPALDACSKAIDELRKLYRVNTVPSIAELLGIPRD